MLTSKLEAAQARIRQQRYPGFAWIQNQDAPWTPLAKPLHEATVALISTCGLYRQDTQTPFDAWNDLGDPAFREIHTDTPADRLAIAHTHYNHQYVAADHNVALPVARFEQLVAEGGVGRLHPWTYSFMGYLPEPRQLVAETAPQLARRLQAAAVDAALLTPC